MKIYRVGGCVRDRLMGIEPKDIDYVVVGSTPEEMVSLGFKQVGADFPVFLHPDTGAEYALARTERKTAKGYHGFDTRFDPSVTIEEDLARRDLTVNAMAQDLQGNIIDPFGGRTDLENKVFSHVSDAFREDPVRVLRVARMCARHPDFSIAPSTMVLMRQMAAYGEVDSLTPERVWKEFERALGETRPNKFLEVLLSARALHIVLPGLEYAASFLKHASLTPTYSPLLGFASCFSGLDEVQARALCKKLKVPTEYRDLAVLFTAFAEKVSCVDMMEPEDAYQLIVAMDAFRKPERIKQMRFLLFVFTEVQFGRSSWGAGSRLELAHGAAASVKLSDKAYRLSSGLEIKAMLDLERIEAIRRVW